MSVAPVQLGDALSRRGEQHRIIFQMFRLGIDPVGQQGKVKRAFWAGEIMNFQPLDLILDGLTCRQHRRNDDESAQLLGHPVGES